MGGGGSKEPTPCEKEGNSFCSRVDHADYCANSSGFYCVCKKGFSPTGNNMSSSCVDIDECAKGLDDCKSKGGQCTNTPGSYTCGCTKWQEEKNGHCVDVNECLTNKGNCDENSDCINQDNAEQLCKCHKGWTGNSDKPGVACRDINECNENPAICPSNSICTNLPGSYKCDCAPGFEPDSSGSGCVTEDFCGTGKNDCDRTFASCSLVPGSFKCECIQGFRGDGTVNTCEPLPGNEELACVNTGLTCGGYRSCTKSLTQPGVWECVDKSSSEQLGVFMASGATADTPTWIWAVVALAVLLIILLSAGIIWCLYKRFAGKTDEEEEDLLLGDGVADMGGGYSYGATQGAFA